MVGDVRAREPYARLDAPPAAGADVDDPHDQAELDELLEKISADGMDGLSADEKRRLNEISKRLREVAAADATAVPQLLAQTATCWPSESNSSNADGRGQASSSSRR